MSVNIEVTGRIFGTGLHHSASFSRTQPLEDVRGYLASILQTEIKALYHVDYPEIELSNPECVEILRGVRKPSSSTHTTKSYTLDSLRNFETIEKYDMIFHPVERPSEPFVKTVLAQNWEFREKEEVTVQPADTNNAAPAVKKRKNKSRKTKQSASHNDDIQENTSIAQILSKMEAFEEVTAKLTQQNTQLGVELTKTQAEFDKERTERAREKKELQAELKETRVKLVNVETELKETQAELKETRVKLVNVETELKETQAELKETRVKLVNVETELKENKAELTNVKAELKGNNEELTDAMIVLSALYRRAILDDARSLIVELYPMFTMADLRLRGRFSLTQLTQALRRELELSPERSAVLNDDAIKMMTVSGKGSVRFMGNQAAHKATTEQRRTALEIHSSKLSATQQATLARLNAFIEMEAESKPAI